MTQTENSTIARTSETFSQFWIDEQLDIPPMDHHITKWSTMERPNISIEEELMKQFYNEAIF